MTWFDTEVDMEADSLGTSLESDTVVAFPA